MGDEKVDELENRIYEDFVELSAKKEYYQKVHDTITSDDLPPCFTPKVEAFYLMEIISGLENTLEMLETTYREVLRGLD